jgi:Bacterial membrane protein YfhO
LRLRDLPRDRGAWGLVLVALAMFYRPLATETFFFRDLYLLFYPKRLLLVDALRAGRLPLWDPFTNGGVPFLTLPSNFAWHPSNVLYLVLPTLFAFNLILVAHFVFCAVAAYWAARVVRLPAPSAFVAGAAYAFCGFTLSTANLTPLLLGLPWIPMTIALAHRALRDRRSIVPAAFAAAMPLFGAAVELTAMLFAILGAWIAFARIDATPRARAIAFAIIAAGAIGLSLIVTLPATTIVAQSSRGELLPYENFASWSVSPLRLPELAIPRFLGNPDTLTEERYWGRNLETGRYPYILSLYLGVPVLLLAFAGAFRRGDDEIPRRALAVIALIAVVLSLGRHLPGFHALYENVPLLATFRYPVKAQVAMLFPIAMLAACGVEVIRAHRAAMRTAMFTAALALLALVSPQWFVELFNFSATPDRLLAIGFFHVALASLALAVAIGKPKAIAAVVALDLAIAGYTVNTYAPRNLFDEPPAATAVREATGGLRFHATERPQVLRTKGDEMRHLVEWQLATLADYNAATFGIPVVFHSDYDGLAHARTANLTRLLPTLPWDQRLAIFDRAGVRVFATTADVLSPQVVELVRLDMPGSPLHIYGNRGATAARFVSDVLMSRDPLAMKDLSRALVETNVAADRCGNAPVRLLGRSLSSARYEVDAPCRGLVVLAENHDPGWRAWVDGRETPHVRADYAFTAVPVARGRHTIERRYFPPRLIAGAIGTAIAIVTLLALAHSLSPPRRGEGGA